MKENKGEYIIIKGRAGMEYYDKLGRGYFIDSEMAAGDDYSYAIYIDSIVFLDNNLPPAAEVQVEIIKRVEYLCKKQNMKFRMFHNNIK